MGSFACPNKNSKEWKMLVNQSGEKLAEMAFIYNGYEMPDVRPLEEIKKAISWKPKTENFAGIAKKLAKYNKENGTSHSFTKRLAFGNTWELTLLPNYLPVNEEKKRQRLANSHPELLVNNEKVRRQPLEYIPSPSEQEAGFFTEEGDFKPLADKGLYDDIDDSLAADALRQVDEARRMIPENIQEKSQILTGRRDPTELSKQGFQDVQPNRTDLEIVSIYLYNKRYRLLNKQDQNNVEQWADNWLNNSFTKEKNNYESSIENLITAVNNLKNDFNLTPIQADIFEDVFNLITKEPDFNYMKIEEEDFEIYMLKQTSLIEKVKRELVYKYNILEQYKNIPSEQLEVDIYNTLTGLGEVTEKFNRILSNLYRLEQVEFIERDEFIVDYFKGDIFEVAEEARKKGLIYISEEKDDVDYLVATAADQITAVENKHAKKIYTELRNIEHKIRRAYEQQNTEEISDLLREKEEKNVELEKITTRQTVSQTIGAYEDIVKFGEKQLAEVEEMLSGEAIKVADIHFAQRVINLWIKAGDFSTPANMHIILDEMEYNTPEIQDIFYKLKQRAEAIQRVLTEVRREHITKFVQKQTSGELTEEEIFGALKDIPWLASRTLNIGRVSDAMIQAIYSSIEEANMKAQQEAGEIWKEIDDLSSKFLKKAGGNFEILKQKTKDGKETGRLVTRFSHEFFDTRQKLVKDAFWTMGKDGKYKRDPKKIKAYFDWTNRNTITFDPRYLFPDSQIEGTELPSKFIYTRVDKSKQKDAHIAEIKKHLGEKGYEFYIKRVEKKIKEFKTLRVSIFEKIQAQEDLTQEQKDAKFEEWLRENSPYWALDMAENPAFRQKPGKKGYYSPHGTEYTEQVPRRQLKNGEQTEWYDETYDKIEADEDLLNYHTYVIETLNTLKYTLPPRYRKVLGHGILPTIEKSIMDSFSEKGVMMGIAPFMDKLKQLQTTTDLAAEVQTDIDPLTGDIEKEINVPFIEDAKPKINDLVKTMVIKHKRDTGEAPTKEEYDKMKEEAADIVSKQKSWDVTRIMKAHALSVLAHKHKSFIEPQIRMAVEEFEKRKEVVTNKAGIAKTKKGEEVTEEGLKNLKDSFNYFMDVNFFSVGGRKVEGVSKKKLYTKDEKTRKKELEDLLETVEDPEEQAILKEQLDKLGGFRTGSGTGDAALKYMTLKGLGWNVFSAFSNIGFGVISNLVQASDGREFSMANMRKAYMLVMNSIGRNFTFNNWDGRGQIAKKIRTMMDQWDLLQTSNKELFEMTNKSSMSKLKRFGPYSMQERSEYLNYAPVMIAVMMNFKATDPDGNEVDLWNAYGIDGKLKEGYITDVDEAKMILKIKRVIEMNHGDYNNPLLAKATFAGRALSQFRTWMFEGFANRFESEKVDHILSYGMDEPYRRKGRYRSYTAGQLTTTGATLGTMFLPGVGTAIGAGAGYLSGKFFGMQTNTNVWSDTTFALKQLARKLMFQDTQYDQRFDSVDAANMRKNATELYIMVTLMGIALLFRALVDEDDDKERMFIVNFLMNQTTRLQTDIAFYTNPVEFEKLTKTAVPLAQLVEDANTLREDVQSFFNDDHKDEVFRSGPFKGDSKIMVHAGEILPFTAPGIRLYRTGSRVFDQ